MNYKDVANNLLSKKRIIKYYEINNSKLKIFKTLDKILTKKIEYLCN